MGCAAKVVRREDNPQKLGRNRWSRSGVSGSFRLSIGLGSVQQRAGMAGHPHQPPGMMLAVEQYTFRWWMLYWAQYKALPQSSQKILGVGR